MIIGLSALAKSGQAGRQRTLFLSLRILAFAVLLFGVKASAQQSPDQNSAFPPSELAVDNLDRVGASEAQISDVLRKDPGLLVELKRWMAKDTADPGQVLDDADLTTRRSSRGFPAMIQEAGGFRRSAYTQSEDLTRFNANARPNKLGEDVEVDIATALGSGDHNQDLPLRDGDVLTIRQLAGWNDVGASVGLSGEAFA